MNRMGYQLDFTNHLTTIIRSTTSMDDDAPAPFVEVCEMDGSTIFSDAVMMQQEPCLSADRVQSRIDQMDLDGPTKNPRLPNPLGYKASFLPTTATLDDTSCSSDDKGNDQDSPLLTNRRNIGALVRNDSMGHDSDHEEPVLASSSDSNGRLATVSDEANSITCEPIRSVPSSPNRPRKDSLEEVHLNEDSSEGSLSEEEWPDASVDQGSASKIILQDLPPSPVSSSLSEQSQEESFVASKKEEQTIRASVVTQKLEPKKSCFKGQHSEQKGKGNKHSVSFHSVSVFHHAIGLGDSPSVHKGPPVGLTWQRIQTHSYSDVDRYEAERPALKGKKQMRLKAARRQKLLLRSGVSEQEIQFCIQSIKLLKKQQHEQGMDNMDEDDYMSYYGNGTPSTACFGSSSSTENTLEWAWIDWVCK